MLLLKRLIIKKLIVISDKEEKSKELHFNKGLNIIAGTNKTGKSSLIKSIFYTLGCEVKFESEWKSLIDKYLLYFQYGSEEYCITREVKKFRIFKGEDLLYTSDSFHDYSEEIMRIFGVNMDCITNDGKELSITPPLLFRFQYIDQDKGWDTIGQSFTNMKYIKDWKGNTNKYVVGFQDDEFYRLKKKKVKLKKEIDDLTGKIGNYKEFIYSLQQSISMDEVELDNSSESLRYSHSNPNSENIHSEHIRKIDNIEKNILKLDEKLSKLRNERYEKILELDLIKTSLNNLEEDHNFALKQDEKLVCPFCGIIHENTIENRIEIVKDIQNGDEMVTVLRKDLKQIDNGINESSKLRKDLKLKYKILKKNMENITDGVSIVKTYKNQGKYELLQESNKEKEKIVNKKDEKIVGITDLDEQLKNLNSKSRRTAISTQLKEYCNLAFEKLNLPTNFVKLNDFVQVISKTGSEHPRMIYGYHIALYLFNLNRCKSPFNILVIDTPNQQGQDANNLTNIDSILELLLDKQGQTILGTERDTGYEEHANVIRLNKKRNVLDETKYEFHRDLFTRLIEDDFIFWDTNK